jgi:Uma2 family endonuclease
VVLAQPRSDFYANAHPEPEDVFLVIEIADTTLDYDVDVKAPLYASAGIPEVWIWDIGEEIISIYRKPVRGRYRESWKARRGDTFSPQAFPDLEIVVSELFGE